MREENEMGLSVLLPVEWLSEGQCQDLIEQDPLHLYRWLQLVGQAKKNGKRGDGAILNADGSPMSAKDLRRKFGYGDEPTWAAFLLFCGELGLLSLDHDTGAWHIAKWRGVWYVAPSDEPGAVAKRVAEHRARKKASQSQPERDVPGQMMLPDVTNRYVTDVTDVTQEQSRSDHNRAEGNEKQDVVEYNALKKLLAPYQLSWSGETTKRLRSFIARNQSVDAPRRRAAIDASIAKLRTGAVQNNNYAVWNVLDDANRSLALSSPGPAPPDRYDVAKQQRMAVLGR